MSDSTPAFVGLSLGDSSENPKLPSTFNGTCNMFGSPSPLPLPPTHPANQPAQTSVFGSGSGNGWWLYLSGVSALTHPTSGSFGVSGNTGNTTNSVSGACSAQPTEPSAFASNGEQYRPGSGFGQPSRLWDNSLHVVKVLSFMSAAWLSPVSKSNAGGDGFASFAGTPSKFASAASSGKSAFGGVFELSSLYHLVCLDSLLHRRPKLRLEIVNPFHQLRRNIQLVSLNPNQDRLPSPDSDIVIPSAFPVKATTTMTKSLLSPIPIWRLKLSKTGFFFKPFICIY
ncbi:MAG: hypothetical protein NXY57DRAFT_967296 [Lentinula lateritia]|nr:MAG: hypothetical protein NXY57DRAFT_967296 [Lentinula lateritia]